MAIETYLVSEFSKNIDLLKFGRTFVIFGVCHRAYVSRTDLEQPRQNLNQPIIATFPVIFYSRGFVACVVS